jgi:hypothetical protein
MVRVDVEREDKGRVTVVSAVVKTNKVVVSGSN